MLNNNIELNEIYNEDCLATISRIKSSNTKINLVLTSPPYNMNLRIRNGKYVSRSLNEIQRKYTYFDDNMSIDNYYKFHLEVITSLLQVSDLIFYNISIVTGSKRAWFRIIGELNEYLKDVIVWDKGYGEPARLKNMLNRSFELVLIFDKTNSISRQFSNSNFEHGKLDDIFRIKREKSKTKYNKAVFPKELAKKIIKSFSNENDLVYDPFSGSGTTCIVAKELKRNFIGSEIDHNLVEFSNSMLNEIK